ncbi:hypothetical protein CDD81_6268 [Ophiocordyceps australis]|uniref:XPG-I domain-containing protein n=1 Tax=Ophiocordyceps australis TaxID=1399860 RepID=A0A2C5Y351_9HYPO|nr:hypothetical protein CDD81_6268 [Ophiocordyceps australis]
MGIKGIYRELGTGRRVSLSKLAADSFGSEGRPFRIAIDVAIWQFQAQAARGGTNPAIRTLFYRLVRLLGTPIQPIFVFDGPHKPAFKRNKRSKKVNGIATAQAKLLIRLFGFVIHDAPGEAEAECALLQQHGIVDAVLSEDVDTIMFGCTNTLRNWSAEGKTAGSPTHVSLYNVDDVNLANLGLNREGMVLVALMSGGDYLPEGIPGCGVKVACEAARAGFGNSVCRLKLSDTSGIESWRSSLIHELRSNNGKHFRCKHPALTIADDFPNLEILRYYTHPVVSQESTLDSVRQKLAKRGEIDIDSLREFTRETFDWDYRIGAIKFIRVLAPALLVHKIRHEQKDSEGYVKRVHGRRLHVSTDATPELRLSYVPSEVVPIDLSNEVDQEINYDRQGLALNSDDDFEGAVEDKDAAEENKPTAVKTFDVSKPELVWVLEKVVRQCLPKAVQEWDKEQEAKAAKAAAKPSARAKVKKSNMAHGALDGFVRVIKPPDRALATTFENRSQLPGFSSAGSRCSRLPPSQTSLQSQQAVQRRLSSHLALQGRRLLLESRLRPEVCSTAAQWCVVLGRPWFGPLLKMTSLVR